jgi:pilus assembly protein Flp/PilA
MKQYILMKGGSEMLRNENEIGQGFLEYSMILVLVAVVVIIILAILGPTIGSLYSNVVTSI